MSWTRNLNLYIDVDASYPRHLLISPQEPSLLNQPPTFVTGDKHPVILHFLRRLPLQPITEYAGLPAGTTIVLTARQPHPAAATPLFLTTSFAEDADGIHSGTIDLNTVQAIAATASGSAVNILVEIEVRDATNTERISLQFDAILRPQIYTTGAPTPTDLLA